MALIITEATPEKLDTTNATSYSMAAFTPPADSFILVFVVATFSTSGVGSISGGSLSWNTLFSGDNTGTAFFAFYAQAGASPESCTITYDCTGDTSNGILMCALKSTGHNMSIPIAQSKTVATSGQNPSITLDQNMNTNNGYCAGFFISRENPASTPPASWTEIVDSGITSPSAGLTAAYRVNGETGNTVTFTAASNSTIQVLFVEINEASQGVAAAPKRLALLGVG